MAQTGLYSWSPTCILCLIMKTTVTSLSAPKDTRCKTHPLCVNLGVPFWTREKTHKLHTWWQASSSGIHADVTVVLEVRLSIVCTISQLVGDIELWNWWQYQCLWYQAFSWSHNWTRIKCIITQIIVLNIYCTYNKPIPKISHVTTLQNLCKMRYKKSIRKQEIKCWLWTVYFSNVDCEAIRARITLKLGGLLRFMIINAFLWKKSACVGKKILIESGFHRRSHNIPLTDDEWFDMALSNYHYYPCTNSQIIYGLGIGTCTFRNVGRPRSNVTLLHVYLQ